MRVWGMGLMCVYTVNYIHYVGCWPEAETVYKHECNKQSCSQAPPNLPRVGAWEHGPHFPSHMCPMVRTHVGICLAKHKPNICVSCVETFWVEQYSPVVPCYNSIKKPLPFLYLISSCYGELLW